MTEKSYEDLIKEAREKYKNRFSDIEKPIFDNGKPLMSRGKPITFVNMLIKPDKDVKPFADITREEHEDWDRRRVHRTSRVMSEYYSQHSEEELPQESSPKARKAFYEKFPEYKENRCRKAAAHT